MAGDCAITRRRLWLLLIVVVLLLALLLLVEHSEQLQVRLLHGPQVSAVCRGRCCCWLPAAHVSPAVQRCELCKLLLNLLSSDVGRRACAVVSVAGHSVAGRGRDKRTTGDRRRGRQ